MHGLKIMEQQIRHSEEREEKQEMDSYHLHDSAECEEELKEWIQEQLEKILVLV